MTDGFVAINIDWIQNAQEEHLLRNDVEIGFFLKLIMAAAAEPPENYAEIPEDAPWHPMDAMLFRLLRDQIITINFHEDGDDLFRPELRFKFIDPESLFRFVLR